MRTIIFIFFGTCFFIEGCIKSNFVLQAPLSDTTKNFVITNFGALPSAPDNAVFIQKTIDSCSKVGGGDVIVPSGTFMSGPINLRSNINFYLAKGAILKALPYGVYPKSGDTTSISHFIYSNGLKNIKITGSGVIDGQGAAWWTAYKANNSIVRPALIYFIKSKQIEVSGITVQNAPNVHIVFNKSCDSATVNGITISSPSTSPNTDGIDTWSPHINITNCNISDGDDNIAMDNGSTNINVKGCTFGSGHGCSIGSYTSNVANVTVDSCTFSNTTNGLHIKSARGRGGNVQYINYSNCTLTNVTNPILMESYYPKPPSTPSADTAQLVNSSTPNYQHITFTNITITGSPNAGIIWGLPEQSISDVVFDNVKITATSGMKAYFLAGAVFKNGSTIKVTKGNAISTYKAAITGINLTTGLPQ